jgi:hypothetical protein
MASDERLSPKLIEVLHKGEQILVRQRAFLISKGEVPDHKPGSMNENWERACTDFQHNDYCLRKLEKLQHTLLEVHKKTLQKDAQN